MTTRIKYFLIGITALLLCIAVIFFIKHSSSHEGKIFLHSVTFKSGKGWGYSILADERVFIRQEYIPAITGNHPFQTEDEARRVGDLVIKKITNNQQPSISEKDLHDLQIKY